MEVPGYAPVIVSISRENELQRPTKMMSKGKKKSCCKGCRLLLDWISGLDHWNGQLDLPLTSNPTQKSSAGGDRLGKNNQ